MTALENIDPTLTFVTSDHHFCAHGLGALLNGASSAEDALHIALWNETVGKDDLVLYVGDFCDFRLFKELIDIRAQLNGRIVLIRGNHDDYKMSAGGVTEDHYRAVFDDVVEELVIELPQARLQLLHDPDSPKRRADCKLLFGHIHSPDESHPDVTPDSFCCCAMKHGWRPVRLSDAIRAMSELDRM